MRPRFEKDLSAYSHLAKQEGGGFENSEELANFEQVLTWHLNEAVQRQGTTVEVQNKIYEIQKKKQQIMKRLQDWLSCLDDSQCVFEKDKGSRDANFNPELNVFLYRTKSGEIKQATFGEIMTDLDWGVIYSLDKASTPRDIIKKYFLERTKHDLRELLDLQIIESESQGNLTIPERKEAYARYKLALESKKKDRQPGFISETIVKNILKKIAYDVGVDFEVVEGDIYQDVEQKIDFIIHHVNKNRGVEVQPDSDRTDIGIQFTINSRAISQKERQINTAKRHMTSEWHIDDLVLVFFPLVEASKLQTQWEQQGRPAGGPDKLIKRELAEKLFKTLMRNILPEDKADEDWQKFRHFFPNTK